MLLYIFITPFILKDPRCLLWEDKLSLICSWGYS